jgi:putative transposase
LKESDYLPPNNKILSVTVSERAGLWFVSILVEEEITIFHKSTAKVGVDLGIKSLAVVSNGELYENPRTLTKNLDRLRRRSKQVGDKIKGSWNRKKAAKRLAKLHYKIACIRRDTIHKITSHLTKTNSCIVIEDLNVSGMMKNRKFARAIQDVGLYEFRRQLEYKGKWNGCEIVLANRFYPSSKMCSFCKSIKNDLQLSDRKYQCEKCDNVIDRDLNASINLKNYIPSVRREFTPLEKEALAQC